MPKIDQTAISRAIDGYIDAVSKLTSDLQEVCGTFNEFIGAAPPYSSARKSMNLTNEQVDRVTMLLGPDASTIVNVWAIQRKQDRDGQENVQAT